MPAVIWTPKETVELIQALFMQGFNHKDIAAKVKVNPETVRGLIRRKKWGNTKAEAKAILIQTNPQTPATQAQSGRIRNKLADTIEADLDVAARLRPSLARQQKLEPLVRNAKVALGWGEEHTQVLVNISALNPTDPGNAPIDVSSVSTALPSPEPVSSGLTEQSAPHCLASTPSAAPQPGEESPKPVKEEPKQPVQLPHD